MSNRCESKYFMAVVLAIIIGITGAIAEAKTVHAKGYVKKYGKYVAPSQRTKKNKSKLDNYSSKGNINPYTGKKGYKSLSPP